GAIYGSGTGRSHADAWAGFSRIVWGPAGVKEGDVLYVCGTHRETLEVGTSGTEGGKITIRGSCPGDAGTIDAGYSRQNCLVLTGLSGVEIEDISMKQSASHALVMQGTKDCKVSRCAFSRIGIQVGASYTIDGRYAEGAAISGNILTGAEGAFPANGIIVNTGLPSPAASIVEKNRIDGIGGDGITAGSSVLVSENTVSNLLNTLVHSDGIVVQGSYVSVARNTVYDCTQNIYVDAFDYGAGLSVCNNVEIWANLVYGTSAGAPVGVTGIAVDAETGGRASIANLKIYNNTIADCVFNGITVGDRSPEGGKLASLDIRNNVLINNGGYNRQFRFTGHPPRGLTLDYNLTLNTIYDGGSSLTYLWYGAHKDLAGMRALGYEVHGLSQIQPVLSGYTYLSRGNSFMLDPRSEANGAGINLGQAFATDHAGRKRPAEARWDPGCFESL
ncbi:MAG: right-handed parallel beta-helix repeat-containing protein, partial [Syntrophales bacterium]|nr:right-handed parallel beta-helix repeat-containing protein [Syntrophales bacterium]